ncbi:MAG: class I SAM-dependent methyltransferase [Verrucomicrobiota bacterium]
MDSNPPAVPRSWSRRIVLGMLGRFTRDALELELPEGRVLRFGGESVEVQPARLQIRGPGFFRRVVRDGEIGFGEGFMAGEWDSEDVTRLLRFFIRNIDQGPGRRHKGQHAWSPFYNLFAHAQRWSHWLRRNTRRNSQRNIAAHYDLSNAFYALWLDRSWTYSSAYFERPGQPLEDAQEAKYRRLAERLDLRPGQRILEIGCGWGGCAVYLARHYGVHVTGLTISREQYDFASRRVAAAGLGEQVDIRFCDYREMEGEFDAIVSIEMLEAVGHEFLEAYFRQCQRLLKRDGLLGLQVILSPDSRYEMGRKSADWIKKHIFPGGQLPSVAAINNAINRTGELTLHGLESFGHHYARTLRIWRERFNEQLDHVTALGFDTAFVRKWNFYLCYCEAAFATGHINVAQIVYAFPNRETDAYLNDE